MAKIHLEPWQNVATGGTALLTTSRIWPNTLEYVAIVLGGTFTKADITRILVRLGSKPIWDITGSELASICLYEGRVATATVLICPWANPYSRNVTDQYLGAIDFGQVGVRDMTFEVSITGATAPTLDAYAEVAPPKVLDPASNLLFRALLRTPLSPAAAATFAPQLINYGQAGGALLRRMFFFSSVVTALEVKRDGLDILEQVALALINAVESELFPHTPQSNIFTYDVTEDSIEAKSLTTIRKDSKGNVSLIPMQILTSLSGGATFDVVSDVFANLNGL